MTTIPTARKAAKPCEGLLLTAGVVLVILAAWTMLAAAMGLLQWVSTTEVGEMLITAAHLAQQAAVFLYESYNTPRVLSWMLGIWLGAAILEGIVSSGKED